MPRASNVFLNMPFEPKGKYRDLLVAYVAGLAGLGFAARTVLEIPPNQYRLARLRKIIADCSSSIHDLSCVELSEGFPRFNMPFELGLVAMSSRAKWFVFEAEPFRLDRTLSDVKGHDPLVHGHDGNVVVAKLRNVFRNRRHDTTAAELRKLLIDVQKLATLIERDEDSLLGRAAFVGLVGGSLRLAKHRGLI